MKETKDILVREGGTKFIMTMYEDGRAKVIRQGTLEGLVVEVETTQASAWLEYCDLLTCGWKSSK